MVEWYEQHEIGDGVVRITEPHVDPLLKANLWWLRGSDRDVVVDAGLGVVGLRQAIPQLFERDPLVVLTHAHLDHVGGAHEFSERVAHRSTAGILARGVPASLYGTELYEKLGIDTVGEDVPDLLISTLPHPEYDPGAYGVAPVTLTRGVEDGDKIDLGDRTLTVIHLPGHTMGCIALLEERTGVLYSGDTVYDGYLIDELPESDMPSYRQSMEFLAQVNVSAVHPGHGRSFDQTRLHELAQAYIRRTP